MPTQSKHIFKSSSQKKHFILKCVTKTQTVNNYADQSQMANIMFFSKHCGIDQCAALSPWIFFVGLIHHQTLWRSAGEMLPGCLKCSACFQLVCASDALFAFNSGVSLGTKSTPSHLSEIIQRHQLYHHSKTEEGAYYKSCSSVFHSSIGMTSKGHFFHFTNKLF